MIQDLIYRGSKKKTKNARKFEIVKRRIFGIFCLLILFTYLTGPVLPYLEYLLYKNYIAKNLCVERADPDNCCQGKCFLTEQLIKFNEPVDADRNDPKRILQDKKVEDHLLTGDTLNKNYESETIQKWFYNEMVIESFLTPVFVPPRPLLLS